MDQAETSQLKKPSRGEYSQSPHPTGESTTSRTNSCSQASNPTRSDHGQKGLAKDVFLSHSGIQKDFVRSLKEDLTAQHVTCFFDEDRESLPVGEKFPPRIFEATETCRVAVLVISDDFLQSKWPMLELSAFVKAKYTHRTNPNLKILPVFFKISTEALKQITADNNRWKELEKSEEKRAGWHQALNTIRGINGLKFSEGGDEMRLRDEIVTQIRRMLLLFYPRYHVPAMQGGARMCQEVADFFIKKVSPNGKGIRIAGLYGMPGLGKTTLGKTFCNLKLGDFDGKVCHLEFSVGDSFERIKLALQYLTQYTQTQIQSLTTIDQAQVQFKERVRGLSVLLVLDNITDKNMDIVSYDEVRFYLGADLGKNSCIILSARSVDVLKYFNIDSQSCMRVPRLEEEEAIAILLERICPGEPTLGAEDRGFALKCANRCLFKETSCDIVPRSRAFHPLALKAFGGYLSSKYGSNKSSWVAEIDGFVDGSGDGFDEVFAVLGQAFDDMDPIYQTIFILLTVYMLPNMSPHKVTHWLEINCNKPTNYIKKAVMDLKKKAFIENFEPEIRIHDLYIEFAQSKAKEMRRWLWWKGNQLSTPVLRSEDNAGFELVKLEQCMYRSPSQIAPKYLKNLLVLQLVSVQNMKKLDLGRMDTLRSITLHDCEHLATIDGMEHLLDLAWLQIRGVNPILKLPELSRFIGLQHLEIDIPVKHEFGQMGDLTPCVFLREINIFYPSLLEFPRVNGLPYLEKVEFSVCHMVMAPLDCTGCVELQSIVLNSCSHMVASPLLAGCNKLSKIVLSDCDAVSACPDIDEPSALKTLELFISSKAASAPKSLESCYGLENLQLWNMGELRELPSFRRLSNLIVLKFGKCGISKPPDLTCCVMLEYVYFFTLKNLESFPNFSLLRKLKILSLYNCRKVRDPPDISGCHQLQVFHLLYNDNMKGLSKMDDCAQLDEIKVSWHCEDEVTYEGIDPDICEVDEDFQSCLEHFKEEIPVENLNDVFVPVELRQWQWMQEKRWMQGRTMLARKYFRGVKMYYCITAPYESYKSSKFYSQNFITLRLMDSKVVAFPTLGRVSIDRDWLNKVREYFAGKKDIARASVASSCENMEAISLPHPPSPMYHVAYMQGQARMCQEAEFFFNTTHPNEKGIRIVGLYGVPGQGKTTLCKAFCNLNLGNYVGKVCHLEFSGCNSFERIKLALRHLTPYHEQQLKWIASDDDARYFFTAIVEGQRVLLVLDNITEDSIDEVRYYLGVELGKNSCILLTARSVGVLKNFSIDSQSCMRIPRLEEEEAIAILLEKTSLADSALGAEHRGYALKCANICSFKEGGGFAPTFHPLALKAFGRHFFSKHRSDLSRWVTEIDGFADGTGDGFDDVFTVRFFHDMDPKYRTIFRLLNLYRSPNVTSDEVVKWLATDCNEEIKYIKEAVEDLSKNAFTGEAEPEISLRNPNKEFTQV